MSRKKIAWMTVFLLIALSAALFVRRSSRLHREQQQRDQLLASTLSALSNDVKLGTARADVDAYLHIRHIEFFQRSGTDSPLYSDVVLLGRRPSGVWYCGPVQFGVEVEFKRSAPPTRVGSEDLPSDQVSVVQPYDLADNCL